MTRPRRSARPGINAAVLVVNAHHVRRCSGKSLPEVLDATALRELNVTLAFWNRGWLDDLSDDLTSQALSDTDEEAVLRAIRAIEETTGLRFPRPVVTAVRAMVLPEKPRRRRAY